MRDNYETLRDFTYRGLNFRLSVAPDDCYGKPWQEECGHVDITESRDVRSKRAGDVVVCAFDRGSGGYICNIPDAMTKARAEGWGVSNETREAMRAKLGREPTAGEITARAVTDDIKRMRDWCRDIWYYVVVRVELLDVDGEPVRGCDGYIGGVESDAGEYLDELATDQASEIIAQHNLARVSWYGDATRRIRIRMPRERMARVYRGVAIMPADANASGIRWTARLGTGERLRTETLCGMRAFIRERMGNENHN